MWVTLAIPLACSSCSADVLARVKVHNHVVLRKTEGSASCQLLLMNCLWYIQCLPVILRVRCSVFTAGMRLCAWAVSVETSQKVFETQACPKFLRVTYSCSRTLSLKTWELVIGLPCPYSEPVRGISISVLWRTVER